MYLKKIPLYVEGIINSSRGYLCRETALSLLVGDVPEVWNIVHLEHHQPPGGEFHIPNGVSNVRIFTTEDIPSFVRSEELHLNTLLIDNQGNLIDTQGVQDTFKRGIHIFHLDSMKVSRILENNIMTIMDYFLLHSISGIEMTSADATRRIKRYSPNLIKSDHNVLREKFISILSGKCLDNIFPIMEYCGIFRAMGIPLPDVESAIKSYELGASPMAIIYSLIGQHQRIMTNTAEDVLMLSKKIKNTYEIFDAYVSNRNTTIQLDVPEWKSIIGVLGEDKALDLGCVLGGKEHKKVVAAIESS